VVRLGCSWSFENEMLLHHIYIYNTEAFFAVILVNRAISNILHCSGAMWLCQFALLSWHLASQYQMFVYLQDR
jgi:hypothetical protein